MKKISWIFALSLVLIACGGSNTLLNTWSQPGGKLGNKVMVLSNLPDSSARLSAALTTAFIAALEQNGIQAMSAENALGMQFLRTADSAQIVKKMNTQGFSSIVMLTLQDKKKSEQYNPGYVVSTPNYVAGTPGFGWDGGWGWGGGWWGGYNAFNSYVYQPGYWSTNTDVRVAANVFGLPSDKMIFYALGDSYNASSNKELSEKFAANVMNSMKAKGLY